MVAKSWLVGLGLVAVCGVACVGEPVPADTAMVSVGDGLVPDDNWMNKQCPAGHSLVLTEQSTGKLINVVSCGDIHAAIVAESLGAHGYSMPLGPPDEDERIGEAQQPWSILGLACAIAVTLVNRFVDAKCDTPECHGSNDAGTLGAGIACALL